jgi:hypothetical protein
MELYRAGQGVRHVSQIEQEIATYSKRILLSPCRTRLIFTAL